MYIKVLTGFYSNYFLVPKKDGGLRPVLDLRRLNMYIKVLRLKMLTTAQILEATEPNEWFTTIDLKDAYFHVPIHPDHKKFLRFAFQSQAYQFEVLPFGLSLSPRVFTRVVSAALCPLQMAGIKILPYLDDWLICAPSRHQVLEDTERVINHIRELGFCMNHEKSNVEPRQQTLFLGLVLNSLTMTASLAPQRVTALSTLAQSFRLGKRIELAQFQKLLGMISAAIKVAPLGLLKARPLQWWINKFQLHPKLHRRVRLKVTRKCIQALHPWLSKKKLGRVVPLGNIPARRMVVTTDASLTGWGAVWQGRTARGSWMFPWNMEHINVLELKAVYMALKRLIVFLQDKHVLVRTDNMSAVYHINHQGGTRSLRCLQDSRRLLFWAHPRLASIRAIYIPGVVNRAADLLSRTGPPPEEWRLHPEVVGLIWDRFGRAHTDLFASTETTHCKMWFAMSNQGGPLGVDELSHEWLVGLLYAPPPPLPLIPHVLRRVELGHYRIVLIAPKWPMRPWFPLLLCLVRGHPWPLPIRADLVTQVEGQIWHPSPAMLKLWVWPLLSPSLMS